MSERTCVGCGRRTVRGAMRCDACATPAGWLEWLRQASERVAVPEGSAAGGACWVPEDGDGVRHSERGYVLLSGVVWPDGRAKEELGHRVSLAAHLGRRLRDHEDGATQHVHHLCRRPGCVRPDHLELLDGKHNAAERTARASVAAAATQLREELEVALAEEHSRVLALLRDLGICRDERDEARQRNEVQAGTIMLLQEQLELERERPAEVGLRMKLARVTAERDALGQDLAEEHERRLGREEQMDRLVAELDAERAARRRTWPSKAELERVDL